MNDELDLELERYELFAGPTYNFNFNRRQFLKAFSGGIALIVPVSNLVAPRAATGPRESPGAVATSVYLTTSAHGSTSTKKASSQSSPAKSN
jgi:hypothetical protein